VDDQSIEVPATADADLVLRTRSGDASAFGELWRRHYASGMTVARSITSSIDPDDLVQESYTRIYQAILKGGGPNGSFRAYLFTSIRNTAAAWGRARRETAIDELDTVADPASSESALDEQLDHGLTAQAFRSLPSRWQEVLWYSEIEQLKPAAISALLGMSAGAVSQLSFRAREGLREAWIQTHLRSVEAGSECEWTVEHLGAYSRGNLATRAQQRAVQHLDNCARCVIVAAEAKDVSGRLALVLLPLVLGVSGASAYLAALQQGGAPILAVAAMPSGVIEGAVVVTSGSGAAAPGAGSSGSGAAGGSGSSSGSGGLTGIGALVGAGSAALIVAGIVAAGAVVPGMLSGSPATSQPSASDSEPSSISSEVMPDPEMAADQPMVIDVEQSEPPAPNPAPRPHAPAPPPVVEVPPVVAPSPVPTEGPADVTVPEANTPETEPTAPPAEPTAPTDPGTTDPGTTDPDDSGSEPTPPVELTWGPATVDQSGQGVTRYQVPVTGAPGATVQAQVEGDDTSRGEAVLDGGGMGTVEIKAHPKDLTADSRAAFRYVIDGVEGDWSTTPLSSLVAAPADKATPAPADKAATAPAVAATTAPADTAATAPADTATTATTDTAATATTDTAATDTSATVPADAATTPAPAETATTTPAE
jgi:RNA polymerase sigma factor (sigma-70 family)